MINQDKKSQHVRPGDDITADLINSIIDSVPKMHNPSCTLGFRETENGLLLHQNNIIATGGGRGGHGGLRPFKLRWMPQDDEDQSKGEWQIYLPMGCADINEKDVYFPKNDIGTDADGEVTFQWYKIETPSDSDATITTSGTKVFKEWTVYVHFKDFPMMYASTTEED